MSSINKGEILLKPARSNISGVCGRLEGMEEEGLRKSK